MGAGHSIAVQNFNENIGILVMVGIYALMVRAGISISSAIVLFGMSVTIAMLLVVWRHRLNQREYDSMHLIGADPTES
jgi:membrane-bound ClpP family serine protease